MDNATGRTALSNESRPSSLHRFAVITAAATFCLIFVGGLVTSTGSGESVPDWPLAFGKLVPKLVDGVRFEYGHRVAALIVVLLTLTLMVWTLISENRSLVRKTAVTAFGLVIVQAILGGITVLLGLPLPIAVAHSATAQAFLCVIVAIVVFTDPWWEDIPLRKVSQPASSLPVLAAITTGVIYLQILIGAVMRHLGAGLAIPDFPLAFGRLVPPIFSLPIAINFAHRCGALVVTAFVGVTVWRLFKSRLNEAVLRREALWLVVLLIVQITLGALTILSRRAVIPTTAHVAVGAAVLAMSFAMTLRLYHLDHAASAARGTPAGQAGTAEARVSA